MRRPVLCALVLTTAIHTLPLAAQAPQLASAASDTTSKKKKDLPLDPARRVAIDTDEGSWLSVDMSPDGRGLVFDMLGDLYLLPASGGDAVQLTNGMAMDVQPRFSPDGKRVVFVSDRDGADNVWILELDSKKTRQITKGKMNAYRSPEWTPDGNYIVVSKGDFGLGPQKLWMYHKDGGNGIQLIKETPQPPMPQSSTVGAAFSGDGRFLWYAQRLGSWNYNAQLPQYQLYTLDRKTGRRDVRTGRYGSAFRPTLSPDGRWLVYGTRYESQTGLRIRDLESGDERWLAYPVQRDDQESIATLDVLPGMSFTPDSKALVASYGGKLWRIPVDGSAPSPIPFRVRTQLEVGPQVRFAYKVDDSPEFVVRQIRDAVPSPDGRKLALVAMDRLYVMDFPGGTPRRLTTDEVVEATPVWSPDGQWIAYVTWTEDGGTLRKVRAAGNARPVTLSTTAAYYTQPAWSPDGARIVVVRGAAQAIRERTSNGPADLVWIPAAGGRATFIAGTEGRGLPHFVVSDTSRIYLYSNGAGLVSIRWDGTDQQAHLKVTGFKAPQAQQPAPANSVRMAPRGDQALVQLANDLYVVTVPVVGGDAPVLSLGNPQATEVPVRRLTDVGGQFPAWSADARKVHYSIGNAHFVYDLDRAKQVDDSLAALQPTRAAEDSARAATDSTRRTAGPASTPRGYQAAETRVVIRARRDVPQASAVLRGARIVTMKGAEVIERGDVVVRNNRIVAVGATGQVQVPEGARVIDVAGRTIVPGFVDTHAHLGFISGLHNSQPLSYLANLAYGVTTIRDPQTGTTDILAYEDAVQAGTTIGPRIYSTGPGLFAAAYQPQAGEEIKDLDHARRVLRRYSQYYDTKTLKMYMGGNRQQRQWIIQAAREQNIMPTTEGALDFRYDLTMLIDGYSGQEHSIPLFPVYKDVVTAYAQTGIAYTPTLLVSYGGPWIENFWYTTESPAYNDPKLQRFTPYEELASKARRRMLSSPSFGSGGGGGWFMEEEYAWGVPADANKVLKAGGRIGVGSHGQLQGLGYHWEMWSFAKGGMAPLDILRSATILGAESIGLEQELGTIETGKLADLVILDGNPLENIRNTNTVRMVMKNGRLYDGATLDEVYPRQRKLEKMPGTPERPSTAAGIRTP